MFLLGNQKKFVQGRFFGENVHCVKKQPIEITRINVARADPQKNIEATYKTGPGPQAPTPCPLQIYKYS